MIGHDCFNFHSLSLAIMFEFKWFMMDGDNWQNHAMRLCNCKQIWRELRSAISVVFEILVKKLRVKDTHEAYQEMKRMNCKISCRIFATTLVILPFDILVWAHFWQNCWLKNYHSPSSAHSNGKNYCKLWWQIWTCPEYMIVKDSQW